MTIKEWFKNAVNEVTPDEPKAQPYVSEYKLKGFLLTSKEKGKVAAALNDFCELWREYCKRSKLSPPHSSITTTYNDHESAAIFPCGGKELGMLFMEEAIVHEAFENTLLTEYPEIQWVHVAFDTESATLLGHTGVE